MNERSVFFVGIILLSIMLLVFPWDCISEAQESGRGQIITLNTEKPPLATPTPETVEISRPDGPSPKIEFGPECKIKPQSSMAKQLKILTLNYDIGNIKQDEYTEKTITFKNAGDADLNIFRLKAG